MLEAFETLADCQQRKIEAAAVTDNWDLQKHPDDRPSWQAMHFTECIASDDPRLAK